MPKIANPPSPIVAKLNGLHFFHFDIAPCAQRVRFMLAEKGMIRSPDIRFDDISPDACHAPPDTWKSRIVSLVKKEHFTEEYSKIQPNLVIPALVHDGELYIESMDIIEYLDSALDGPQLVPAPDDPRYQDAHYLTELGKHLHPSIRHIAYRYGAGRMGKINRREQSLIERLLKGKPDDEKLVKFYKDYSRDEISETIYQEHLIALTQGLTELENRLQDGRKFLTGNDITMADAIWIMKVITLNELRYPFTEMFPAVAEWHKRISSRPSYKEVMVRQKTLRQVIQAKAWLQDAFGGGLPQAVKELTHA